MPISKKGIAQRNKTFKELQKLHPKAWTELEYKADWQLLIAVILSAQATDKIVNGVTRELFKKYKSLKQIAKTSVAHFDKDISRINFHSGKARSVVGAAKMVLENFDGRVPRRLEKLIELPGVGRKTANVVLGHAFGTAVGVVVDTHVARLANRFGWTRHTDPAKIEQDLMKLFPKRDWVLLSDTLIHHGRYICKARNPKCAECPFEPFCPGQKH